MSDPRTATGAMKVKTYKAIEWYRIKHGLKYTASSAYPTFYFKDQDGKETEGISIDTILEEYEQFKKDNHGAKKVAA